MKMTPAQAAHVAKMNEMAAESKAKTEKNDPFAIRPDRKSEPVFLGSKRVTAKPNFVSGGSNWRR